MTFLYTDSKLSEKEFFKNYFIYNSNKKRKYLGINKTRR